MIISNFSTWHFCIMESYVYEQFIQYSYAQVQTCPHTYYGLTLTKQILVGLWAKPEAYHHTIVGGGHTYVHIHAHTNFSDINNFKKRSTYSAWFNKANSPTSFIHWCKNTCLYPYISKIQCKTLHLPRNVRYNFTEKLYGFVLWIIKQLRPNDDSNYNFRTWCFHSL